MKPKKSKILGPRNFLQFLGYKRAAVWVSTVLYTVIGLAIIGILLAVARPKIQEMQDSLIIEQTIKALNVIDEKILKASEATGTTLNLEFKLAKGQLIIDGSSNQLRFEMEDSRHQLSENNKELNWGKIKVLTEPTGDVWKISLWIDYSGDYDLTYDGENVKQILEKAKTPYSIWIRNEGYLGEELVIDISVS